MDRRYEVRRGLSTMLGVAGAGALVWVAASQFDRFTVPGYWYRMALLAAAGLAIVLSQVVGGWTKDGRPGYSPTVFVLGFVPVLLVVGWVLVADQPAANTAAAHMRAWAADIHANGLLNDFRVLPGPLAFLLGLALGLPLDTWRRRPAVRVVEHEAVTVADAPTTRERIATPHDTHVLGEPVDESRRVPL